MSASIITGNSAEESSCWSTGTSDSSSSSSSSSEEMHQRLRPLFFNAVRRRAGGVSEGCGEESRLPKDGNDNHMKKRTSVNNKHRIKQQRQNCNTFVTSLWRRTVKSTRRTRCGTISTFLLCCCVCLWLAVFLNATIIWSSRTTVASNPGLTVRQRTRLRTENANRIQQGNILDKVKDGFSAVLGYKSEIIPPPNANKAKTRDSEALPTGCKKPEWQDYSFPTCNDVHEIDLASVLRRSATAANARMRVPTTAGLGYVASGLWRSVWAVDPRATDGGGAESPFASSTHNNNNIVVLKTMRREHDVTARNLDRHRRDALVMERLTASPYVVNAYAYCGNSVLTEFLDTPLEDLVLEDTMLVGGTNVTEITGETRIKWALDMARAIQALHEIPNGPIVHADLQAGQFLVSPETGTVKVNDFNRCRFMTQKVGGKNETAGSENAAPCTFRIPSAPGKNRAPEEYSFRELDEKLDIFSVANILYSILTKKEAWEDRSTVETKNKIQDGFIPEIEVDLPDLPLPIREMLIHLNQRAYAFEPTERIGAAELASELEKVLASLHEL